MQLTLFDLDHTLLSGDTDALWCSYLIEQGELDPASFAARDAEMQRGYRAGTVALQAFIDFYASTLAQRSPAQWQALRSAFLHTQIAPRLGAAARALVHKHQAAGDLVVLTTATNRFLAEISAAELQIEHLIATELELLDGIFTGRSAGVLNMREGKVTRLHTWLAARGQSRTDFVCTAYSDSINDLPLLLEADVAVAVNPDSQLATQAQERRWPILHLDQGGDVARS